LPEANDCAFGPLAAGCPFCKLAINQYPVQLQPMFHALAFILNSTPAAKAGVAVRATSTKTTTIKG